MSGAVAVRWLLVTLAVVGGLAAAGGCGAVGPAPTRALLQVETVPPGAAVYVDERFAGTGRSLGRQPVRLRPGRHLVTIEASGYFPHDLEVDLPPGLTRLRVALRPVPP